MRRTAPVLLAAALATASCSDPVRPGPDVENPTADAGDQPDAVTEADATPEDAAPPGVGPRGGAVERFRFAVFGDVRPPMEDDTAQYPTAVFTEVMSGIQDVGSQFAVATGDYMFARNADVANLQVDAMLAAETRFPGHVFHGLGNHECTGATASNCPNGNETGNIRVYRERLTPMQPSVYFDFVVNTSMGDAHFVVTAPNAWSSSQAAWLGRVLAQPATYTFVVAHEPPTSGDGPGSVAIEDAIRTRAGGVTLRLYGHTHDYRRIAPNAVISGNAGAPLSSTSGTYGFITVEQRTDGNVEVTAYDIGRPPMVADRFVVRPDGT